MHWPAVTNRGPGGREREQAPAASWQCGISGTSPGEHARAFAGAVGAPAPAWRPVAAYLNQKAFPAIHR